MDVKKFNIPENKKLCTPIIHQILYRVFYHLYNNAFQPGSKMDARISISDPDKRMVKTFKKEGKDVKKESRISTLKPNEIGYLNIANFKQRWYCSKHKVVGTILEVTLA